PAMGGKGVSFQAWLKPADLPGERPIVDLGGAPGGGRLALVWRGGTHTVAFMVGFGGKTHVACEAKGVQPGAWTQVSATLDDKGQCAIYLQGQRAADGRVTAVPTLAIAAIPSVELAVLLQATLLPDCALGATGDDVKSTFGGD